jgi:hypothetical protein
VALATLTGCGDSGSNPDGPVDQETFIASYVDLRTTALGTETGELDDALRAEVLERNGVSEGDLLAFVELHGEDVALMQDIWDEIESRMDASGPTPDSVPGG